MPRLSVTYNELNDGTKRPSGILKYLGFRSSSLVSMLNKLKLHEDAGGDAAIALALLKASARSWRRNHPKEFANRDKLSGGLCSNLFRELAIPPTMREAPEPNCSTYQIVNDPLGVGDLDATNGTFTKQDGSVLDTMRELCQEAPLGVLIVDVQTSDKRGALEEASRVGNGLHVKYDSQSVLQNQADVVALATELKIPIFNVNASASGDKKTVSALTSKFPKDGAKVFDFNKQDNNVLGDMGADHKPKFLKVLREGLGDKSPTYLVVMGFNANQCVQGSVFGNAGKADYRNVYGEAEKGYPKVKGLLEYGYTVVTARNILASANAPLEPAWGPLIAGN